MEMVKSNNFKDEADKIEVLTPIFLPPFALPLLSPDFLISLLLSLPDKQVLMKETMNQGWNEKNE